MQYCILPTLGSIFALSKGGIFSLEKQRKHANERYVMVGLPILTRKDRFLDSFSWNLEAKKAITQQRITLYCKVTKNPSPSPTPLLMG